eukprot:TRINITY_DN9218_c0_g1_i1.p1 TRINITY_DN9218_c0_g1~~TRINITY_DN9218_c0_g1_i1.p1  ORF type:complete len:185 (-),score=45.53 TRINITY_DN9218_c0_g1_i1:389-874(-)
MEFDMQTEKEEKKKQIALQMKRLEEQEIQEQKEREWKLQQDIGRQLYQYQVYGIIGAGVGGVLFCPHFQPSFPHTLTPGPPPTQSYCSPWLRAKNGPPSHISFWSDTSPSRFFPLLGGQKGSSSHLSLWSEAKNGPLPISRIAQHHHKETKPYICHPEGQN